MPISKRFIDCIPWQKGTAAAVADDIEQLTYSELQHVAQQIATLLHSSYGSSQFIVLRARSNVQFVTTFLGIMYSGNIPIPINCDLPAADVGYIQEKSRAVAVVDPMTYDDYKDSHPDDYRDNSLPALVMYTSGTSAFPKGVIISQDNLIHSCTAISRYLGYDSTPSAAVVLPLHYSYALLSQVCCMLFVGGFIQLFAEFRNPIKFAEVVNDKKLETFCGVPSTYNALALIHGMSKLYMPTIRTLCSAGAAMDQSKFTIIKEIFPNSLFFNNYGMTEAAPRISYIREDDPHFFEPTCGKAMDGVHVKIVDPNDHTDMPDHQPGMLVVHGANITSGYLNDEQLSLASFTHDGYLISGDIAHMDKGYIFIHGRSDDTFNVGGEKVGPLEIERVLNKIPGIQESAVAGFSHEQRGMVPYAFLKLDQQLSRKELLRQLKEKLVQSKLPQRFFEVTSFPMTSNGKLQRRRLMPDDTAYVVREIL